MMKSCYIIIVVQKLKRFTEMDEQKTLTQNAKKRVTPWAWIPTLYVAEGLPNVVVMTVAVVMYMQLGMSDGEIALYTSWLGLPWVIKPFWSPFVDLYRTAFNHVTC